MGLLNGIKNPEQAAKMLMQSNPQFADFCEKNKGKTPEQIAQRYGIDLSAFNGLIGKN